MRIADTITRVGAHSTHSVHGQKSSSPLRVYTPCPFCYGRLSVVHNQFSYIYPFFIEKSFMSFLFLNIYDHLEAFECGEILKTINNVYHFSIDKNCFWGVSLLIFSTCSIFLVTIHPPWYVAAPSDDVEGWCYLWTPQESNYSIAGKFKCIIRIVM